MLRITYGDIIADHLAELRKEAAGLRQLRAANGTRTSRWRLHTGRGLMAAGRSLIAVGQWLRGCGVAAPGEIGTVAGGL